jgi:hypothetical protein
MAAYRRQQELSWLEQLVEDIEGALEEIGGLGRVQLQGIARPVPLLEARRA